MLLSLHPHSQPRPTSSRAERIFWEALKEQLPPGWAAWHSLRIRTPRGFEGENDFVIWVPDQGVILMEVKGGVVTCNDGRWKQSGHPMRKSPLDQVRGYMGKLLRTLKRRHPGVQCEFAAALCLPQTGFSKAPRESFLEGRVLGEQDLPHLGAALQHLATRLFTASSRPIIGDVPAALHDLWGETWAPRLRLGDRILSRKEELVPLDEQQCLILDMMADNDRVLFLGGPGTGKTLLAAERARRMIQAGRRPLYLCSTASLARKMRTLHSFPIYTVRELAAEALMQSGDPLQGGAPQNEWTPKTWQLAPQRAALEAAPQIRELHDGLIVDEAQDFAETDWHLVRALGEGLPLWGFADPGQAFWEDREIPEDLFPTKARLPRRYRCPEALAAFADLYRREDQHQAKELAHEKTSPISLPEALSESFSVYPFAHGLPLDATLSRLIAQTMAEGTRPEHIAVLSLGRQEKSELCHVQSLGSYPVRRGDDEDAAQHIICDTFLRFKGLERAIVFVCELEHGQTRYNVRMHAALTRAQVQCIVIASPTDLERDPRLQAALVRDSKV